MLAFRDMVRHGGLIGTTADDRLRQLTAAWDVVDGYLGDFRSGHAEEAASVGDSPS